MIIILTYMSILFYLFKLNSKLNLKIIKKYWLQVHYISNESNFKTNKSTRELCAQYEFILISVTDTCIAYAWRWPSKRVETWSVYQLRK
jgi:hypothetical protein